MQPEVETKLAEFFGQYPVRAYKKGQILIHAGDQPEHVFHLVSGRVKKYDLTYRGDEVILNVFKEPSFFPMSNAMTDLTNWCFYEAEDNIEVHIVPFADINSFIKANPDVLYDLLARVYRGTEGMLQRMAQLMSGTARSRVIIELIIACRRFGTVEGTVNTIALNETDIGARAGLSRETVNREVAKLKTQGLIKMGVKSMIIPDLAALEANLGQDL